MDPRLSTSKAWTAFPADFSETIQKVFQNAFKAEAKVGEFLIDGRIYANEILFLVGYLEKGRLRQANFETSIDYTPSDAEAIMEKIYVLVDATAEILATYFESEKDEDGEEIIDYPYSWTAHRFQDTDLFIKFSSVNTQLEQEADRLLGVHDPELVKNTEEEVDAMKHAVVDTDLAKEKQKEIRKGPKIH